MGGVSVAGLPGSLEMVICILSNTSSTVPGKTVRVGTHSAKLQTPTSPSCLPKWELWFTDYTFDTRRIKVT